MDSGVEQSVVTATAAAESRDKYRDVLLPYSDLPSETIWHFSEKEKVTCNKQLATDLHVYHNCNKSCKEMGGATSVMPVIRDAFGQQVADTLSGLIPSIGRYAVIGCKLQVPT